MLAGLYFSRVRLGAQPPSWLPRSTAGAIVPELISGGPNIPILLLNELDDGNVVFFCGAGVSMGPGSDLPNFECLVDHVYSPHHLRRDAAEQVALSRCEFDKALGLLGRSERLGERQLRRTVIERLSTTATGHRSRGLILFLR